MTAVPKFGPKSQLVPRTGVVVNGLKFAKRDDVVPGVSTVVSMRCVLTPPALAAVPVPNTVLPQAHNWNWLKTFSTWT